MTLVRLGLAVLAPILLAGCAAPDERPGGDRPPSDTATRSGSAGPAADRPVPTPAGGPRSPARKPRTGIRIISADSDYGSMLFDATGQPIYLFTAETDTRPVCDGQCAEDWPPVLTTGRPSSSGDVRDGLLGTTSRSDGTTQVTYGGHPLYYYAHEGKYQVLCHDVTEYGGTWLVVRPDGTAADS